MVSRRLLLPRNITVLPCFCSDFLLELLLYVLLERAHRLKVQLRIIGAHFHAVRLPFVEELLVAQTIGAEHAEELGDDVGGELTEALDEREGVCGVVH